MNRQYYSLAFLVTASLLLSLAYCPPFDLMLDDKEIFKYAGMAVLRGNVPYRDFFDHKPPFIYFINAAGFFAGTWGLWTINASLSLLCTLCFYACCRRYRLPFPWLLPLLFNLMIRDNLISEGINMTREYTAFFTLLFFCVLLSRSHYRFLLLGLLSALVFFTQQDQALPLIPLLISAVIEGPADKGRRIAGLVLGGLALTVPLLLYFAVHRSLGYFWEDAFRFNSSVYTTQKKSLWEHFRTIKSALDAGNYELPFLLASVLGGFSLLTRNRKKGLVLASLLALLLTLSPEMMGGRWTGHALSGDFIYYFLPLSAPVCMVLFTVFAFAEEPVLMGKKALLPYVVLLCSSLGYTALQHGAHLKRRNDDPVMNTPELGWLRQQHPKDYQLFVFFNDQYTYFYTELKVLAPTRWVYQHFYSTFRDWDSDRAILHSIQQSLIAHRTAYVITDPATLNDFYNVSIGEEWLSFLKTYYQPVPLAGRTTPILWRLKDSKS